jgi:hypothetical protein
MKRWTSCIGGALVALTLVLAPFGLKACSGGESCEQDVDCLILCQCAGIGGFVTVGPYACRFGTCGSQHSADLDCERPCREAFVPNISFDDDDSAGDDDDSAVGDDDSEVDG